MNIFKMEKLKSKRSGIFVIVTIIPLISALFSLFFGGVYNFVHQAIFWWMSAFSIIVLGSIMLKDTKREKNAGNFFNVNTSNQRRKILNAKLALSIYYSILASISCWIFIVAVQFILPKNTATPETHEILLGLLAILLSSIWILPSYKILEKKLYGVLIITMTILIQLFLSPLFSQSSLWFLFPFAYPFKVAEYIFRLKPSGDILTSMAGKVEFIDMLIAIGLSVVLFVLLVKLKGRNVSDDKK